MEVKAFIDKMKELNIGTIVGVPDSTLKQFCNYMNQCEDKSFEHFVPANEGAAVGIAIGEYLATGRPACVYMQNSGLGNTVNPITSLANEMVYGIPMLLLIGWRGKPGQKDEPQHKFMGEITCAVLDDLSISYAIINKDTSENDLRDIFLKAETCMRDCKQFAIVAEQETFAAVSGHKYANGWNIVRENAIAEILKNTKSQDVIVSTTGKISREVYEQSNQMYGDHSRCFLTVGGMGHASMIAFGVANRCPDTRVYCIEGDGALLMHMGSMAFLAEQKPQNMVHICLNNEAHESVGGMPTGATPNFSELAKTLGYDYSVRVEEENKLRETISYAMQQKGLVFVEICVALSSRADLGRPKESAAENKVEFMKHMQTYSNDAI